MALSDFITEAIGEVGYTEDPNDGWTKYGYWFGGNSYACLAWCAMFVSYCANIAGILTTSSTALYPYVFKTASVQSMYTWYSNNRRNLAPSTDSSSSNYPQPGDLAFINGTSTHIGIIVSASGNTVTTVEGNYDNSVAMVTYTAQNGIFKSGNNTLSYIGSNHTKY